VRPALVWRPGVVADSVAVPDGGETYVIFELKAPRQYYACVAGTSVGWAEDTLDAAKAAAERHWQESGR